MRLDNSIATSKVSVVCQKNAKFHFYKKGPPLPSIFYVNFEDFPEKANMLPILVIYLIICRYVFLEHCTKVKNTLPDVIQGGKTFLKFVFCLLGP